MVLHASQSWTDRVFDLMQVRTVSQGDNVCRELGLRTMSGFRSVCCTCPDIRSKQQVRTDCKRLMSYVSPWLATSCLAGKGRTLRALLLVKKRT